VRARAKHLHKKILEIVGESESKPTLHKKILEIVGESESKSQTSA
jgi:hypothetical protein